MKPFKTLKERMSPEAQRRAKEKTRLMLEAMPLQELRKARESSREEMANALGIEQETPPPDRGKIRDALAAAGLVGKESPKKTTKPSGLSLAERKRLGRLFSGKPSLSEIVISERDGK